jgi:adenosylcobinamide-GDP ribazoletransferase
LKKLFCAVFLSQAEFQQELQRHAMGDDIFNKIREALAHIITAAMFLSRLPLNRIAEALSDDDFEADFGETAGYFGLAAMLVALPSVLILWVASLFDLPSLVCATLAVATHTIVTGALHEDALCDVADGFGGGKTREDKLRIMRDSQIGTYGASALMLGFLLHIFLLAELLGIIGADGLALVIIAANMGSTVLMIWPWAALPPARSKGGLSASHGIPTRATARFALSITLPIVLLLMWLTIGLVSAIFVLAFGAAIMFGFTALCRQQIGGHTGDTLGATKKFSELGLLLALIVAT